MQSAHRLLAKYALKFSVRFQNLYIKFASRFAHAEALRLDSALAGTDDFDGLVALYPQLQRILFIHIPKCGGTAIRRVLVQQNRCAPIPEASQQAMTQAIAYMTNTPRLPQARQLLQQLGKGDDAATLPQRYLRVLAAYHMSQSPGKVFFLAHKQLRDLLPAYREGKDVLLTTVRAPAEILRSLVAYRVYHTVEDALAPHSQELLKSLQLDIETFRELAEQQPRQLTELILRANTPPSLSEFLSCDGKTDCEAIWSGIKRHTIYISHKNEQIQMQEQLFGKRLKQLRENVSEERRGLAADFMAALDDSWIEPFLDRESVALYQKLESSGIIGFWQVGGTTAEYQELLRKS
jgi:hypothetical protein